MNTKEFAAKVACSPDTLRFYEHLGMLVPARTEKNCRCYTIADLATYRIIHSLKRAGFSLKDIKNVLQVRETPVTAVNCTQALRFVAGKHAQFQANQRFYADLAQLTDRLAETLTTSTLSPSDLDALIEQIGELDDQVV